MHEQATSQCCHFLDVCPPPLHFKCCHFLEVCPPPLRLKPTFWIHQWRRDRWLIFWWTTSRVWNGLDQSAGFIIQSSPGGFGLDWIRNLPTQRILDWTRSRNVQCVGTYPTCRYLRQFLLIVTLASVVLPSNRQLYTFSFVLTCIFYNVGRYLLCCVWI